MQFTWDEAKRKSNFTKHKLDFFDAEKVFSGITDWNALETMNGEDIDLSDIPEITDEQFTKAKMRIDGKPVTKGKVRVKIFLDAQLVAYFKLLAGGRGYQTLINEALKESIRTRDLETMLLRVIREELDTQK